MTDDERHEKNERDIAQLRKRIERVEGELGIVPVDDNAGIPTNDPRRDPTQLEN